MIGTGITWLLKALKVLEYGNLLAGCFAVRSLGFKRYNMWYLMKAPPIAPDRRKKQGLIESFDTAIVLYCSTASLPNYDSPSKGKNLRVACTGKETSKCVIEPD
jgi:hypothetical protein